MKKLEALIGGVLVIFVLGYFAYNDLYKIDPRDFLNDRVSTFYANEGITYKNLKPVEEALIEGGFSGKGLAQIGTYLDNIYVISRADIYSKDNTIQGILDPGFMYPLFLYKSREYFEDAGDGIYILKDKYKNKYIDILKNQDIFMMPYRGLIILGTKDKELKNLRDEENYHNEQLCKILDREKSGNMGVFVINLDRVKVLGFDEMFISGDLTKDNLNCELVVGGNNRIIRSFFKSNTLKYSEKQPLENGMYFAQGTDGNLNDFFMFLRYFLKNYDLDYVMENLNLVDLKNTKAIYDNKGHGNYINVVEDQFFYGNMYLNKIFSVKENVGSLEVRGYAKNEALILLGKTKRENLIKLIKEMRVGGQNDKNIQHVDREVRGVQTS